MQFLAGQSYVTATFRQKQENDVPAMMRVLRAFCVAMPWPAASGAKSLSVRGVAADDLEHPRNQRGRALAIRLVDRAELR